MAAEMGARKRSKARSEKERKKEGKEQETLGERERGRESQGGKAHERWGQSQIVGQRQGRHRHGVRGPAEVRERIKIELPLRDSLTGLQLRKRKLAQPQTQKPCPQPGVHRPECDPPGLSPITCSTRAWLSSPMGCRETEAITRKVARGRPLASLLPSTGLTTSGWVWLGSFSARR